MPDHAAARRELFLNVSKTTQVGELIDRLEEWGAAHAEITYRDADDTPVAAVIVVQGIPETGEIIAAIDALQDKWDDPDA